MEPRALNARELRKNAGMTMAQVAERTHFCLDYIWKLETGRAALSSEALMRLAELFAPEPVRVAYGGRLWKLTPDEGQDPEPPEPDRRPNPYSGLTDTEKVVRLGKELGEARARADELPASLLSPQARREHLKRLLKEGIEADMILEAVIEAADPDVLSEAEALSAQELAAEMGVSA